MVTAQRNPASLAGRGRQAGQGRGIARHAAAGVTLIELMIAIAIVGILVMLAVPNFRNFIIAQEVRSTSFDIMAALTYARSEAIKRNSSVTVQAVDAGDWGKGWSVKAVIGGVATDVRTQEASKRVTVMPKPAGTASVVFTRTGRAANVAFEVDDNISDASITPRCISISLSGQPGSTQGACP